MTYIPEQLEEMSDHDINVAVAEKQDLPFKLMSGRNGKWVEIEGREGFSYSPTSLWQHVMPIAEKHDISVRFIDGIVEFDNETDDYHSALINGNPKRAICEVFLQMNIGE